MTAELQAMIEGLPGLPGVYFFWTQHDDLVYIGKSIHIRKSVQQHFQGKDSKSRKIQRNQTNIKLSKIGTFKFLSL